MRLKIPCALLFLFLMTGCVSTANLSNLKQEKSVIDFTYQLIDKTTGKNLDSLFPTMADTEENSDFKSILHWWCPKHATVSDPSTVHAQFSSYCKSQDGELFENGGYCLKNGNESEVVFAFKAINSRNKCQTAQSVYVAAFEPTSTPPTEGFFKEVERNGILNAAQQAKMEVKKAIDSHQEQVKRNNRLAAINTALISNKGIGDMVCSYSNRFGYVEQINSSKTKIKVRIVGRGNHKDGVLLLNPAKAYTYQKVANTTVWANFNDFGRCNIKEDY
ncbi:MAG: hypothetical protein ACJAWL_003558 [Motiliproteus sp.]|jgi:hypothetical protein